MALGPGKYDTECEQVLRSTDADMVLVIVLGGVRGAGFSASIRADMPVLLRAVPGILRVTADAIERDTARNLTESLGDPQ